MIGHKEILFLTGNELKHNYLIGEIINISGIQNYDIVKCYSGLSDIEYFCKSYDYDQMNDRDQEYFLNFIKQRTEYFKNKNIKTTYQGEVVLNSVDLFNAHVDKRIQNTRYDLILCFGCPIIHSEAIFSDMFKTINIHMGLCRYYRGGASNIYALDRKEFHKVGLTVHKVSKFVDSGEIVFDISLPELEQKGYRPLTLSALTVDLLNKCISNLTEKINRKAIVYKEKVDLNAALNIKRDTISISNIMIAEKNLRIRESNLSLRK